MSVGIDLATEDTQVRLQLLPTLLRDWWGI